MAPETPPVKGIRRKEAQAPVRGQPLFHVASVSSFPSATARRDSVL